MSLRCRLLVLTGLFFAVLMGIGWTGLMSMDDLNRELLAKHRRTSDAELQATLAQSSFRRQVQEWFRVLLLGPRSEDLDKSWANLEREEAVTRAGVEALLLELPPESAAVGLAQEFSDDHARLGEDYRAALEVFLRGGDDAFERANAVVKDQNRRESAAFEEIVQTLAAERQSMQVAGEMRKVQEIATVTASMVGAAILSFGVLAILLHRWVNRPVLQVIEQADRIAGEDFEQCDAPTSSAEIAQLQRALNLMAERLKKSHANLEASNRDLIRARDEALDASRLKSEFLANVSHEMRTPLNGVIGMSELLVDTPLDRDQAMMASTARSCGKTLLAVINDLLDFSKIEANCIELHCIEFDLEELLEESVLTVAPKVDPNDVALGFVIESGVPPRLLGDPVRLKQIFTNLLSNAGKFTKRGEISLRVQAAEKGERGVRLRFLVSDTGSGIPREKLTAIFEAFRQADGTATREHSGTGLGLTISQRLAELMGGAIEVESEVGKGSRFSVDVWFQVGQGSSKSLTPNPKLEGKRVLIVDDHGINREILTRQIESWGCQTHAVALAIEALDVIHKVGGQEGVDLVISDYQMPGIDGYEFARRVKDRADAKDLPIVLLSSVAPGVGLSDPPEGLFVAVATKPVIKQSLYEVVTAALSAEKSCKSAVDAEPESRPATPTVRLLLVEDDPMNRKYLSMLLRKSGFEHEIAENGEIAVEAVQREHFDVILMDCSMPVMDGYEATRKIREMADDGHGPVIIGLTGHTGEEARERCMKAGMDQHLSKPVEPEELLREIDRLTAPATC